MKAVDALDVALALYRSPATAQDWRHAPLPEGMEDLLRLACGEAEALAAARRRSAASDGEHVEIAAFALQQLLFAPQADHYRVLAASADAPATQLRRHYRWLMKWLHPDRQADAWDAVYADRVNQAWQAVKTPERRARHDAERLDAGFGPIESAPAPGPEMAGSKPGLPLAVRRAPVVAQQPASAAARRRRTPLRARWVLGSAAALAGLWWLWPTSAPERPGWDPADQIPAPVPVSALRGQADDPPQQWDEASEASAVAAGPTLAAAEDVVAEDAAAVLVAAEGDAAAVAANAQQPVLAPPPAIPAAGPDAGANSAAVVTATATATPPPIPPSAPASAPASAPSSALTSTFASTPASTPAPTPAPTSTPTPRLPPAAARQGDAASAAPVAALSPPAPAVADSRATAVIVAAADADAAGAVESIATGQRDGGASGVASPATPAAATSAGGAAAVATAPTAAAVAVPTAASVSTPAGAVAAATVSPAPAQPEPMPATARPALAAGPATAARPAPLPGSAVAATQGTDAVAASPGAPPEPEPEPAPTTRPRVPADSARQLVQQFASAYAAGNLSQLDALLLGDRSGQTLQAMRERMRASSMRYLEVGQMTWAEDDAGLSAVAPVRDTWVPAGERKSVTVEGRMRWHFDLHQGGVRIALVEYQR